METIKPGTRCECATNHGGNESDSYYYDHMTGVSCKRDAVRLVTVWHVPSRLDIAIGADRESKTTIALCAPCAEYHESKGV